MLELCILHNYVLWMIKNYLFSDLLIKICIIFYEILAKKNLENSMFRG